MILREIDKRSANHYIDFNRVFRGGDNNCHHHGTNTNSSGEWGLDEGRIRKRLETGESRMLGKLPKREGDTSMIT